MYENGTANHLPVTFLLCSSERVTVAVSGVPMGLRDGSFHKVSPAAGAFTHLSQGASCSSQEGLRGCLGDRFQAKVFPSAPTLAAVHPTTRILHLQPSQWSLVSEVTSLTSLQDFEGTPHSGPLPYHLLAIRSHPWVIRSPGTARPPTLAVAVLLTPWVSQVLAFTWPF